MKFLAERSSYPRVEILLSTFNGETYLRQLLDSILAQDYTNIAIAIRDDGSTDATIGILEDYARLPNVRVTFGPNLGIVSSFFALLTAASPESEYLAFADQDDVWLRSKISRAVGKLIADVPVERPGLYCARPLICDEQLNPIGKMPLPKRGPSFANSLVENIATGCTIMLNRAARDLLVRKWPDNDVLVHDWWCYQVVTGAGTVVYDPEPVLLYRQHGGNATGVGLTARARLLRKVRRQIRGDSRKLVRRQAEELKRMFYDGLTPKNQRILDEFLLGQATLSSRIRYAFKGAAHRQHPTDNFALKVLYVLDRV